jgi:hypothetical protein
MKLRIAILSLILIQPALAEPDLLDGSFTETGSENVYTVNLQNDLGHVYTGTAAVLQDGSMKVNVQDGMGDNLTGFAKEDADGDGYDISLKNPVTGDAAVGNVDVSEF